MPKPQTSPVPDFYEEHTEIDTEMFSEMLIDWQRAKRLALNESTYCAFVN
jgi:hypothetical protein